MMADFRAYQLRLPLRISQRAILAMKENFAEQGYEDENGRFIRWQPRKYKEKGARRALLIKSGRMRRSPRAAPLYQMARVTTDVPYAEPQHDGFKGRVTQNVKPHTRKMKPFGRGKTVTVQVKGFRRTINQNIPSRPWLTVGKSFLDKEEKMLLDAIEVFFINA